jgi:predicted TIM-barrel fold metal-dependent hydrolase
MTKHELGKSVGVDTTELGIIDCHAHIFPPAGGASGFASVDLHRLHQQRAMHMHGNQPYRRLSDNAITTERMLWDADDPSPAGAKDVCFSAGRFGRFQWEKNNESYYVQFLPPWMEDLSMDADKLIAMMDHAGVAAAVLQNDHIYGNLGECFAEAVTRYPHRFIGLAQVEEAFAYQDTEIARLKDQIGRLKMRGLYFTTTGLFRSGYKPMHSDKAFDPFWEEVERLNIPVSWVQSSKSPVGTYEDELRHLEIIIGKFPKIRHVLVHGIPTSLYADEKGKLTLPAILKTLMMDAPVMAELLYPITVGGREEYPFSKSHLHLQQLIDTFGSGRFMWGSDIPNVERYCTYAQSLSYFTAHSGNLSAADLRGILRENALGIYAASA